MIAMSELQSFMILLISRIAAALRTKEAAIKSTPWLIPKIISALSCSVIAGKFNLVFGILTPLRLLNSPPFTTSQTTSVSPTSLIFNSINPSAIKIVPPTATSFGRSL